MIHFSERTKTAAVVCLSYANLALAVVVARNGMKREIDQAPPLDNEAIIRAEQNNRYGMDIFEIRGDFSLLGTANQKVSLTYVTSSGLPTIDSECKVFMYSCKGEDGRNIPVISQKELPNNTLVVKGRLYNSADYFDLDLVSLSEFSFKRMFSKLQALMVC